MNTRIIGIDLAVTAAHKAIVLDQASNTYVSRLLTFHTDPADLDYVVDTARAGASEPVRLQAVLEATGMAWNTVGQYLGRHNVDVYRVNGQQVADLRRVYQRHAKSDRIDARVLARLPLVMPDSLHRCFFPSGPLITLQRTCREVKRLKDLVTASKNRILATDQLTRLGLKGIVPPFSPLAFWLRENWCDPWRVQEAGVERLAQAWLTAAHCPSVCPSERQTIIDPAPLLLESRRANELSCKCIKRVETHKDGQDALGLRAGLKDGGKGVNGWATNRRMETGDGDDGRA